ncbi:hypothetical protein A6E15_00155 [Natrinema saccharevitans]|uniref:DUF7573 domain-containing protein n=1 Tax=Natrinema saccharevitans TaxID=301967 RepID=A0A1S8B160_9EURY|nr:hypothetical protein [Natrinema saccharevitans]OLZ42587.1 hypothetical protein A6E15_00155 [Natrinema saccharevitans]
MTEDATLSAFDDRTATESDGDGCGAETDAAGGDSSPGDGKTARSTYAWGTYTCGCCEAAVDRVWRADGDLVCPDCKSW